MRRSHALCTGMLQALAIASLAVTGCGHRQQVGYAPPPPPIRSTAPSNSPSRSPIENPDSANETNSAGLEASEADAQIVATHRPIYSETGLASWYGPPYHNRRGANGQIFNQNAMTAAHRTLPMNSLIRATNLATGQWAIVRITDRGPFVGDRFLDLSVASAKAIGVWRPGTAQVRIDVYDAPKPITVGGRWCVQVGAFESSDKSLALAHHLEKRYITANVAEFTGPTGHWVRIRPANDDKAKATEIANTLRPDQGRAYLVRMD
ncbi:MAG TPA: septal ring lytic transglycosylase RlpA family protein [Acidisarcina sp.]